MGAVTEYYHHQSIGNTIVTVIAALLSLFPNFSLNLRHTPSNMVQVTLPPRPIHVGPETVYLHYH